MKLKVKNTSIVTELNMKSCVAVAGGCEEEWGWGEEEGGGVGGGGRHTL